jgi:hypothetical protein
MSKVILLICSCLLGFKVLSQSDSTISTSFVPLSVRVNLVKFGVILQPDQATPDAPHGYGLFYEKPGPGFFLGVDVSFFLYEKYGLTVGYETNAFTASPKAALDRYAENAHAGYTWVAPDKINYSCDFAYLELSRRFPVGKFRFEPGIRIGNGKINSYANQWYLKQNGTNYWKFIKYESGKGNAWNFGLKTDIYYQYTPLERLVVNGQLNLGVYMALPTYDIAYSEQYYGIAETKETFKVRDQLWWFRIGIALNLEWIPRKRP